MANDEDLQSTTSDQFTKGSCETFVLHDLGILQHSSSAIKHRGTKYETCLTRSFELWTVHTTAINLETSICDAATL